MDQLGGGFLPESTPRRLVMMLTVRMMLAWKISKRDTSMVEDFSLWRTLAFEGGDPIREEDRSSWCRHREPTSRDEIVPDPARVGSPAADPSSPSDEQGSSLSEDAEDANVVPDWMSSDND
ncbi:hypothetical protein BDW42DRAFT_193006 [Aspergillus taichungensis]|uniref:Uncharacterized protein n=1 Tax=Aspergillus taichungensis TaxID=482145 RepID=A0A2J5HYI2_9EURO|nr:hypothetical protein BDW42DRAFT_193006 [Aspergillus taichungensis]